MSWYTREMQTHGCPPPYLERRRWTTGTPTATEIPVVRGHPETYRHEIFMERGPIQ